MIAARGDGLDLVQALLASKASVGPSAVSGDSPLAIAAGAGRVYIVGELLKAKASTENVRSKVSAQLSVARPCATSKARRAAAATVAQARTG